ncbi:hypothetical protein C1H46_019487 [Malus baccata]|uniref:Uncharacterized protein n=1 Tax=Malus baccata TaxID=106549 RepID=A0A540M837_MALBA|nr:hypothetical protein C1H46_019487 [Malus baccata]
MTDQDFNQVPLETWRQVKHCYQKKAKLLEKLSRRWGQFSAPATVKLRPRKIVKMAEEEPRPHVCSVETESVVGLKEKVQVSDPKIDSGNDSSNEYSNDERGQYTALDEKTTSIDMVIGDMILEAETTQIDMIIGDKADIEKSQSTKLFKLKAEIGEIIMPGGHNNCPTQSATDKTSFIKPNVFGDVILFDFEKSQTENFDIKRSQLGIKHRWPPPLYCLATFVFLC